MPFWLTHVSVNLILREYDFPLNVPFSWKMPVTTAELPYAWTVTDSFVISSGRSAGLETLARNSVLFMNVPSEVRVGKGTGEQFIEHPGVLALLGGIPRVFEREDAVFVNAGLRIELFRKRNGRRYQRQTNAKKCSHRPVLLQERETRAIVFSKSSRTTPNRAVSYTKGTSGF
jgi:hypothetical protein